MVREGVRVFSDFAIWYLFLAGTAGGAFLCATVMDVRANPGWDVRRVPLCARCGMFGAFGLLALAALMLFCDLGNPFDIWYLFESPLRSIVSMGAWLIMLGLALSLAVSAMIAAKVDVPYVFRFLEIAGAVAAVGVMGYTGVLLSSMAAVEFWNTWLLVALFVVSAVSCGCAFISLSALILSGSAQRFPALKGAACLLRVGGRRGAAVLRTAVFGTACRDLLGRARAVRLRHPGLRGLDRACGPRAGLAADKRRFDVGRRAVPAILRGARGFAHPDFADYDIMIVH